MWNRLRYTVWAPAYDTLLRAAGRPRPTYVISRLRLAPGDRVLIVGAGTGLDLDFLPPTVHVTAIDVTPAMLKYLERRAAGAGRSVTMRIMDARQLELSDASFEPVVMHLNPCAHAATGLRLKGGCSGAAPGGRIAGVRQVPKGRGTLLAEASMAQRVCQTLFSNLNQRIGPLIAGTPLVVERDEAVAFAGTYRVVTLMNRLAGALLLVA